MQKIAYKFMDKQTRFTESPKSKVADETLIRSSASNMARICILLILFLKQYLVYFVDYSFKIIK